MYIYINILSIYKHVIEMSLKLNIIIIVYLYQAYAIIYVYVFLPSYMVSLLPS